MLVERVSESKFSGEDGSGSEKQQGRRVGVNLDAVERLPEMRSMGDENVFSVRFGR